MTGRPQCAPPPAPPSPLSLQSPPAQETILQHSRLILCASKHKSAARPRENLTFFILGEFWLDVDLLLLSALQIPTIRLDAKLHIGATCPWRVTLSIPVLLSFKSVQPGMDFQSNPVATMDRCNIPSRSLTRTFSPFSFCLFARDD